MKEKQPIQTTAKTLMSGGAWRGAFRVTRFCLAADYEALLQQLQSSQASSGDSFYVRVNMSLPAASSASLAVFCNDILHVTNTRPTGTEDSWQASQVHPCQLLDLQSGIVPNYYRLEHKQSGGNRLNRLYLFVPRPVPRLVPRKVPWMIPDLQPIKAELNVQSLC